MREKLAILGAGYLQLPLIKKAQQMGYETHVFAWDADEIGAQAADRFYPVSITELEPVLAECKRIGVCGICSVASDLALPTVAYVAQEMGLAGNSVACAELTTNKHSMRLAFEQHDDPSPRSILVGEGDNLDNINLPFPVIVKPTDRAGSRGVCRVETAAQLSIAVRKALDIGFEKRALIEEYAEGQEYSVEYISYKGQHTFLAMTEKTTTGAPHFIEIHHREPAPVSAEMLAKVRQVVPHALDSLQFTDGASHTELKIAADGTIRLIEVNGRMGGDSIGSELVPLSTGLDYMRMVVQVACGIAPDFTPIGTPRPVESVYIMREEDITEMERLRHEEPEKFVKIIDWHPELIGATTDSTNRGGCYIRFT